MNNKRRLFIIVIAILVVCVFIFPLKIFVTEPEHIKKGDEVILVCRCEATTGPIWWVKDSFGIDNSPKYVDIIGETPILRLKKPIYEYWTCDFVFRGRFDENSRALFIADEWNIIAPVWQNLYCLPYGLNIFQYNIFVSEQEKEEEKEETLEIHELYEHDGIL